MKSFGRLLSLVIVSLLSVNPLSFASDSADGLEFFEKSIRPLLVNACWECHADKKQESGLRLDSRDALFTGGDRGPVVIAGKPDESLLIQAVRRQRDLEMPPDKPLADDAIDALVRWIELGAPWPASTNGATSVSKSELWAKHWAFQDVTNPAIPPVLDVAWPRGPIDPFVLSRIEAAGLSPSPPVDRRTLHRRISVDLLGLPPTPEEVDNFIADRHPDAYERLIDRTLASPHFGEQWGRHWLDVARYSDTKGYVYAREERFWVHSWAYRDWVVRSLNRDMPYNRFLQLQLAADQIAEEPEDLAAMGFVTLGRRFLGVTHDIYDDRIDTVTRGMLGLTVSCARCHDHKFDPIPTADYYSLYGVFASCAEKVVPAAAVPPGEFETGLRERQKKCEEELLAQRTAAADRARARVGDYLAAQLEMHKYPEEGFDQILYPTDVIPASVRRWRHYLDRSRAAHDPIFAPWHALSALPAEEFTATCSSVLAGILHSSDQRMNPLVAAALSPAPKDMAEAARRYGELFAEAERRWQEDLAKAKASGHPLPSGLAEPDWEALRCVLYGPDSPCEPPHEPIVTIETFLPTSVTVEMWRLQGEVDRWLIRSPLDVPFATILVDRSHAVEPRVFRRGNPAAASEVVPRQFLGLLAGTDRKPFLNGSGRGELAAAIVDAKNPMTARVIVNRIWMHHFGAGIVRTPSDFGMRADPPSHPELLDWLAAGFMEEGWTMKRLHREIVTSAAYRQVSTGPEDPELARRSMDVDPENRLLWRKNARRMTIEEARDALLLASGELDLSIGGKPVELFAAPFTQRRTIYGLVDREFFPSVLRMFDFANPDLHIPQRSETTVPQQALFFLNHPLWIAFSERLAASAAMDSASPEERVSELYRRVFQREPSTLEVSLALNLVESAALETPSAEPETMRDWQYGYGPSDEMTGAVASFAPLPHFTGSAWQGGAKWPDGALGWVRLTPEGGHAGDDLEHAAIRRWTAPRSTTISIHGSLEHPNEPGDGVRGRIVHNGRRLLASAVVHKGSAAIEAEPFEVLAGDTVDFVVDRYENLNSDDFLWNPVLTEEEGRRTQWKAKEDFGEKRRAPLDPWQQLAQVLLMTNEFVFVD